MSRPAAASFAADRVTLQTLMWVTACLALTMLANIGRLPIWVSATVGAAAALRLMLAASGRDAPPRSVRLIISIVSIGLVYLQFRTFNGLVAGSALLSLIAGLKLLETRTRRDIYVLTMIIYFLSLAALLQGESFWLLGYLVAVSWLTTATLLGLTGTSPDGHWRSNLSVGGRILAHAFPVAVGFWLLFPRFGGPLWQLQEDGNDAMSGLSDTMSPGDITALAQSDEVAFRVRFSGSVPPPEERYWRGPVLHDFDGRTWRSTDIGSADRTAWAGPRQAGPRQASAPALVYAGVPYRYTISLEPHRQRWLFALDWPSQWNEERAVLTGDYMLIEPNPVSQPIDVIATSFTHVSAAAELTQGMRNRDSYPPPGNPRSLRFAQTMRRAHPDDLDYVRTILNLFHDEAFYYTLRPPRLAADSVDEFLFDSKRGFCGHYASAFAVLTRAVGIPTRVVTGYQGGTFNRFSDYWILRQSDAHAWDEIWLPAQGWVRIDPTAMIAPERVERGLNDVVTAGASLTSRWQQRSPWLGDVRLRFDAIRQLWRERILRFDQHSQDRLLRMLGISEPDGQKLALLLATFLIGGMAWLTWQVRRQLEPSRKDLLMRSYARLCRRLAAVGLARLPSEGAESFAERVGRQRPDLAPAVLALCRRYSRLRYSAAPPTDATAAFAAAVRVFRPRRVRPGRAALGRGRVRPQGSRESS